MNGGAWLTVDGTAVDWILRDLPRVREQWDRAGRSEFGFHPQAGHPLGFLGVSYVGELATARILADPSGPLVSLLALMGSYPAALATVVVEALLEADFLVPAGPPVASRYQGAVAHSVAVQSRNIETQLRAVQAERTLP